MRFAGLSNYQVKKGETHGPDNGAVDLRDHLFVSVKFGRTPHFCGTFRFPCAGCRIVGAIF